MKKFTDLNNVKVRVLPPRVITLLAQFAYYAKRQNGTIIKLSSKDVLQEVHHARRNSHDSVMDDLYDQILVELNNYSASKPDHGNSYNKTLKVLRLN